ncbi:MULTISPECIES: winged helix DNA-binding protein [Pseudomonas]|jgi:predicted MarR family transcription regulator|uniref:winged helix DNA-binding protein n=1 Tax=Pseudomonas TaxID=286 RepID=UPI000854D4E7|nr:MULTISPECIES: winged helix DNA-binding protein [Pseudomonas]MBQ53653.1 MarR family transcriptional regulator [Pseudomonadaceae bacterium]HCP56953.1 MarR family transcriptional regulator [Pseudomonas sp.]NRH28841.1 winged helix DNA-binding protein [Pseudomonas sp. MS19]OEO26788.1 MarR family transcriptional regulator [Pseudomonas sp. J237]SFT52651.1 Predicted transcription regulator, contains HTH domain, MarR family [Pseudomonas marincola]|tara:strand:+ start:417 stop:944 length:528 start_codon:yes stop_codon:yes gene_type:complete
MTDGKASRNSRTSIVASSHLAEQSQELSQMEFGLIIAGNAFMRWMERCMKASGGIEMNALDVMVLHSLTSRGRAKRQADICLLLNIEDTHTVTYALKKLSKLGLVGGEKQGKEMFYQTTEKGHELCSVYTEIRQECLIAPFENLNIDPEEIHRLAGMLRALSGLYDQAARAATSL